MQAKVVAEINLDIAPDSVRCIECRNCQSHVFLLIFLLSALNTTYATVIY